MAVQADAWKAPAVVHVSPRHEVATASVPPRANLPPPENWFPAVCGRCGADTTVPFPPDGKRKIYCKDCYKFRHEDEQKVSVHSVQSVQAESMLPQSNDDLKKKRRRKRKKTIDDSVPRIEQ